MGRNHILPNLENSSFADLKSGMRSSASRQEYKRLHTISMFYQGIDYDLIVKLSYVSLRSVQKWIRAFNARGIDGLLDRKKETVGRPKKIKSELSQKIRQAVDDPQSIGYEHVTCVKIHGYLSTQGYDELKYHDVWREVRRQGFVRKYPRSYPEPRDEQKWLEDRENYIEKQQKWQKDDKVELWFLDESGFTGDPRPRQTWAKKGTKTKIGYRGTHIRRSVIGAVCPKTGQFYSHIWNGVDTKVFQKFLDDMATQIPKKEGITQIICLDNASWHIAKKLNWHHFTPCFQPAYSPDLNPIETLWRVMKENFFASFIAKNSEQLIDKIQYAINYYLKNPQNIKSTCSTKCFKRT